MALDWLKGILGDSYTEEIDKSVRAEIGKGFVSKADFDAKNAALKTVSEQLTEANTKLTGYDPEWKTKAANADTEVQKQVSAIKFDYALNDALRAAKVRDVPAVKAHLRMDGLKLDGEKILGLSEQLEPLKKERDYLFESETKPPRVVSVTPGVTQPADDKKTQANAALRAVFGRKE